MFIMFLMSLIVTILAMLMMLIASLISKKSITDREKNSPFECGFDPKNSARLPFSLRFFLIAVIFLIFDVEIALLLPIIIIIHWSNITTWMVISMSFLLILLIGLFHEWNQGALEWAN